MERLVVISGMSGSGKSLAADALEDLGYFCVDNLPLTLVPPFCELIRRGGEQFPRAALVLDVRDPGTGDELPAAIEQLRAGDVPLELLFFDASDEVLKRRYSESRRPHPMARGGAPLEQAIVAEREALRGVRDRADRIIDTTRMTSHELRRFLQSGYGVEGVERSMTLNLLSFGFKYGSPTEADLVFDVRFLPNPHFDDALRPLTGRDEPVRRYLEASPLTGEFFDRLSSFVDYLVPLYAAEGKSYLTVAIGCTGGKHRSVAMTERLAAHLGAGEHPIAVSHRDLGRE